MHDNASDLSPHSLVTAYICQVCSPRLCFATHWQLPYKALSWQVVACAGEQGFLSNDITQMMTLQCYLCHCVHRVDCHGRTSARCDMRQSGLTLIDIKSCQDQLRPLALIASWKLA